MNDHPSAARRPVETHAAPRCLATRPVTGASTDHLYKRDERITSDHLQSDTHVPQLESCQQLTQRLRTRQTPHLWRARYEIAITPLRATAPLSPELPFACVNREKQVGELCDPDNARGRCIGEPGSQIRRSRLRKRYGRLATFAQLQRRGRGLCIKGPRELRKVMETLIRAIREVKSPRVPPRACQTSWEAEISSLPPIVFLTGRTCRPGGVNGVPTGGNICR